MSYRKEKIIEQISHIASNFIASEASRKSLITVTHTEVSPDLKRAKIFFTVLPDSEQNKALDFLKRQRSEFKAFFKENSSLSPVPFFDFVIDLGEKHRQKIDEISKDL
jgi:ribosome-binding factor A